MTRVETMLRELDTPDIRSDVTWTTGNVAEAFPGVFTTLGMSFGWAPMELAFRKMFYGLGVYPASEVKIPENVEDCFWTVFSGWGAGNIDKFADIANVMPGTSASAVEQQLFGYVRPGTVNANTVRRYPQIIGKAPLWVVTTPRKHDAMFADLRRWRLAQLPKVATLDERGCVSVLDDARRRFGDMMSIHMGVAMISSSIAEKVTAAAVAVGLADLEASLLSGVGSDENEVAAHLWDLAHGTLTLDEFTNKHGYHGPNEGQLSGVTWRENPAPVLARLNDYRTIDADNPRAPRRRSAAQAETRRRAVTELVAATPRHKRAAVAGTVKLAARFLALREQGKAGYLITFDVARAAARQLGGHLVARGVIDNAEDVFHLGYDSLVAGVTGDQRAVVAARIDQYRDRQLLRLPKSWSGRPEISKAGEGAGDVLAAGVVITGVAASGGVVEGRARVVRDPGETELDDGDILVCETTDPSWVSLFMVAGGVVTDHGGLLSHGPIVARELGIPCVCGTETGSYRITDGMQLRVDGDRGTVELIG
jgi:pyruvate,water dikinase